MSITLQAGWGLLGFGVDDVRMRLLPDVVAEQAEMFLINGDMQSNLYTSSRAMHSAILGLLQVVLQCQALPTPPHGIAHDAKPTLYVQYA